MSDRDHRVAAAKHAERAARLSVLPPVEQELTEEERALALARIAAVGQVRQVERLSALRRRRLRGS